MEHLRWLWDMPCPGSLPSVDEEGAVHSIDAVLERHRECHGRHWNTLSLPTFGGRAIFPPLVVIEVFVVSSQRTQSEQKTNKKKQSKTSAKVTIRRHHDKRTHNKQGNWRNHETGETKVDFDCTNRELNSRWSTVIWPSSPKLRYFVEA